MSGVFVFIVSILHALYPSFLLSSIFHKTSIYVIIIIIMTASGPEPLDMPGKYYEQDPLQVEAVRLAGRVAVTSARAGGQWEAFVYPGDCVTSSDIPDDAPLLGSIGTDVEGMSEGRRLAREEVLPIVASWFADRGLQAATDHVAELRGGHYENEVYMGFVFGVANAE
ncbi:MAG TPA: hypothetical protein VLF71_03770 [Candidatus Saccharimonadales bacterium]|nr:hypothetical protein [Candidatus Saccharimonadales bacterium]